MTPELRKEIEIELRKVRAPAKVARNLGISLVDVLIVSDDIGGISRHIRPATYDGEGRPELRQFMMARKRANVPWDNDEPAIAEARRRYEAGTHTMCTGRDGEWLILYSIPLRKRDPKPDYFIPEI